MTAYQQGKTAAKNGLSIDMCPYSGFYQLQERMKWLRGYYESKSIISSPFESSRSAEKGH